MEFSKFWLRRVVSFMFLSVPFMFLSVAASGRLVSHGTRQLPSDKNPTKSLDPFPVMERSFVSNGYGALNAFNHGTKRHVPTAPNPAESPDLTLPVKKSFVPTHNFGSNHVIKRQVPSGPNPAESPDPIPPVKQSFVPMYDFGSNHAIKRLVPSGPNPAQSPDPVPPAKETSFV